MGFLTGGIIFKNADALADKVILAMVGAADREYFYDLTTEAATSAEFDGIAIARTDELTLVFGKDLPYSFAFEDNDLSSADRALEEASKKGDVLCYLINSVASTYAWSIFSKGERIRVKCVAGKEVLFESGLPTDHDRDIAANDDGMIQLIENFTGYSYIELIFERRLRATAYIG